MRQHLFGSSALLMLLAGCGTLDVSAANLRTVSAHRTGYVATASQTQTSTAADQVRVLPATHASTAPKAPVASPTPAPKQTPDATGTASATASVTNATTLGQATADADTIRLIPIIGDDGMVDSASTEPTSGLVTWTFQASDGATTLHIASIRVVLQSVACYPTPALPSLPPNASATSVATDTPPLCAANAASDTVDTSGTGDSGVVDQSWPKTTLSFSSDALKCPASLAPGSTGTVSLSLQDPGILKFLRANYGTAQLTMSLTLLDSQGKALAASNGQPFVILQNIQVF
ncbi:MAG TPA: hypothetical protein V6D47_02545 [Oscillatoriaceae cyanobacterium]